MMTATWIQWPAGSYEVRTHTPLDLLALATPHSRGRAGAGRPGGGYRVPCAVRQALGPGEIR